MNTDINKQALDALYRIIDDMMIGGTYQSYDENIIKASLTQPSAWQSIDTAPRDGTVILVALHANGYKDLITVLGKYEDKDWRCAEKDEEGCDKLHPPVYWIPLPKPPVDVKGVE